MLRDATNLLVHLAPAPVVARVQTATTRLRDPRIVIARALAVTTYLDGVGAPVAAPSKELPPGPHELDGQWVSFWEWHDHDRSRLTDPCMAGRLLAETHDALATYPEKISSWDPIAETRAVLVDLGDRESAAVLEDVVDELGGRLTRLGLPTQVVHGDAHLGNLLCTSDRMLWTDWELTHVTSTAWDLAALVIRARMDPRRHVDAIEAAFSAYGPSDPAAVALHVELFGAFQTGWWLAIQEESPSRDHAKAVEARMARWRHREI